MRSIPKKRTLLKGIPTNGSLDTGDEVGGAEMIIPDASLGRRAPSRQEKQETPGGKKWGRSTDFIVTEETFGDLAARNPAEARSRIVMKLYEACSMRVYAFLRRSVNQDTAEDLTQETFLRLLQLRNLEKKSISISYLFRVAQNLVRRRYNLAARLRGIQESVLKYEVEHASAFNDSNQLLLSLEAEYLEPAFESLVSHEREAIRLIICEGMSYSETARIMGVPVSTVNNWKHRALRKLRGFIDDANSEHDQTTAGQCRSHASGDSPGGSRQQGSSATAIGAADQELRGGFRNRASELPARAAG